MLTLMFILDDKGNALDTVIAFSLHETAHIITILAFGGKLNYVSFSMCEIDIKTEKEYFCTWQKIIVSLSGPFCNFLLAFLFGGDFATINLIIGSFQLLPVISLDGDCVLEAISVNEKIRKTLSFICCFIFALIGFYILILTKYNFSVLIISLYLICCTCTKQ